MKPLFILFLSLSIRLVGQSTVPEPISVAKATLNQGADKIPKTSHSFVFQGFSREYTLSRITPEMSGNHFLGDSIAKRVYLLDENYTSIVAVVPGNPQTKTVIKKPVIYTAVKRVEKYLVKSARKGMISRESAAEELRRVLDIALSIQYEDTRQFEEVIQTLPDEAAIIDLFTKKVYLNF